jgi:hypothetical protein
MKSPAPTQNTSSSPMTLRDSLLQAWSRNAAVAPVSPFTMPNTPTTPESEAVQREKLLLILDAAIALVDDDDFDSDPDETPQSNLGVFSWRGADGNGDSCV